MALYVFVGGPRNGDLIEIVADGGGSLVTEISTGLVRDVYRPADPPELVETDRGPAVELIWVEPSG